MVFSTSVDAGKVDTGVSVCGDAMERQVTNNFQLVMHCTRRQDVTSCR